MRKQLMGKFRAEKDKMPAEKKTLVLTHFPRFLSLLEEEIYSNKSPIWDPDFRQSPPPHVTQMSSGVSAASVAQPASKTGSSDSDSTLSNNKKRMLDEADNLGGSMSNKRQRLSLQSSEDDDSLDEAIAEIVAVIEDKNQLLG